MPWCKCCNEDMPEDSFEIEQVGNKRGQRKNACRRCCVIASVASSAGCEFEYEERTGESGGGSYAKRNAILRDLGFKSYRDYLDSDLWKRVRGGVFKRKGNACFLCGGLASLIHHNNYARDELLGENVKRLAPLCGRCHTAIEFRGMVKLSLFEAKAEYWRRRRIRLGELISAREKFKAEPQGVLFMDGE